MFPYGVDRTALAGHRQASDDGGDSRIFRNAADSEIAEIGDELAVARALSALAHELLHAAATDIEAITHERVHLHD